MASMQFELLDKLWKSWLEYSFSTQNLNSAYEAFRAEAIKESKLYNFFVQEYLTMDQREPEKIPAIEKVLKESFGLVDVFSSDANSEDQQDRVYQVVNRVIERSLGELGDTDALTFRLPLAACIDMIIAYTDGNDMIGDLAMVYDMLGERKAVSADKNVFTDYAIGQLMTRAVIDAFRIKKTGSDTYNTPGEYLQAMSEAQDQPEYVVKFVKDLIGIVGGQNKKLIHDPYNNVQKTGEIKIPRFINRGSVSDTTGVVSEKKVTAVSDDLSALAAADAAVTSAAFAEAKATAKEIAALLEAFGPKTTTENTVVPDPVVTSDPVRIFPGPSILAAEDTSDTEDTADTEVTVDTANTDTLVVADSSAKKTVTPIAIVPPVTTDSAADDSSDDASADSGADDSSDASTADGDDAEDIDTDTEATSAELPPKKKGGVPLLLTLLLMIIGAAAGWAICMYVYPGESGSIMTYQQTIAQMSQEKTEMEARESALMKKVSDLESEIGDLTVRYTELESLIASSGIDVAPQGEDTQDADAEDDAQSQETQSQESQPQATKEAWYDLPEAGQMWAVPAGVNFRKYKNFDSDNHIEIINKGKEVLVVEERDADGWIKIYYNDYYGYVNFDN